MADEYLEGIMNRQSPAMTAQDVDRVIALPAIPDEDADFTPDLARKIIEKYQAILESQAQALSEANTAADLLLETGLKYCDRIEALESRLAEAMRVIDAADKRFEKIALCIERNLYHQREKVEDARSLAIQGREAARDFLNAANARANQEKTDAR